MLLDCHTHSALKNTAAIASISLDVKGFDASHYPWFSVGFHPWQAGQIEDNFFFLEENVQKKNCVAIGEIGLDKLQGPNFELQKEVFLKQILLSEKLDLPVLIHCVKAWNEMKQLKDRLKPDQTWVFHGFNKSGILPSVLESSMMISIGPSIFENAKLQTCVADIPEDRILFETDDSGVDIFTIYEKVSEIKKIPLHTLEKLVEENFKRTFTKWQIG
jgi:TatD DNase family protein